MENGQTNAYPSYLELAKNSELAERANLLIKILENCCLCPWECRVNRLAGETGQCQTSRLARVYAYSPHHGEERPLSGTRGSGTIFFSGCNLHCVFCQNADISQQNIGLEVSSENLAQMMLSLQGLGCHNINLVSPTHVIPQIVQALLIAVNKGLRLPLVYNTGGYDQVNTLKLLDGVMDIYMPDMKYFDPQIAERFSGIRNYPAFNQDAVREMYRQVGDLFLDQFGLARRGLLIRHLVLPGGLADTTNIARFISKEISANTYVNIMGQYRPEHQASAYLEINRRITREEYQTAIQASLKAGLTRLDGMTTV